MAVAVFTLPMSLLNLAGIDIMRNYLSNWKLCVQYSLLYCTLCEGVYWIVAITTDLLTLRLECNIYIGTTSAPVTTDHGNYYLWVIFI